MKTISAIIIALFFSFQSLAQSGNFWADKSPFEYLIGKEYADIAELDSFEWISSGTLTYSEEEKYGNATLLCGDQTIVTFEKIELASEDRPEKHIITDILVFNKKISTCTGCLQSRNKNRIITIHPYGSINMKTILYAFRMDIKKGAFKNINPEKMEWKDSVSEKYN